MQPSQRIHECELNMNVHDGQCSLYNLECTYISHQVAYCLCIYIYSYSRIINKSILRLDACVVPELINVVV